MKKVLLMPFLQISSGHHQVANSIEEWLVKSNYSVVTETIDILSYTLGKMEALVSNVYLKWIDHFPQVYSWLYKKNALNNTEKKRYYLYDYLFKQAMLRLLEEKKPDLIICTHALPSYVLGQLKQNKQISIPVVNAYTDYFINTIWGKKSIEYHLVPDQSFKTRLMKQGCNEKKIFVTGIPVHPTFMKNYQKKVTYDGKLTFIITGGSLGIGSLNKILQNAPANTKANYKVLCGQNNKLFDYIKKFNHPNVTPISYISSRERMNHLYEQVNGIITKPGGVTISECLYKRIPIFIHQVLPGQEEMNLKYLKNSSLAYQLHNWQDFRSMENQLITQLSSETYMYQYTHSLNNYHNRIKNNELSTILYKILQT